MLDWRDDLPACAIAMVASPFPIPDVCEIRSYTAVILLAFNRWTNDTLEKSGIIDFDIARIVFSVCIFFSIVLLAIDWFRAVKVIKSDGVAEAYMDLIAVGFNCIWGGKGKGDTGWKRFLVFSRLTKSRGVVDYLALFTYFAFKGWVRIIFAEGPRVVINALTFISVTQADVIVHSSGGDGWEKFGKNVEALYNENKIQVMILGTMAFTSLFWVMAVLRVGIPAEDGGVDLADSRWAFSCCLRR